MSRIADALSKGLIPATEVVGNAEVHPWGDDLVAAVAGAAVKDDVLSTADDRPERFAYEGEPVAPRRPVANPLVVPLPTMPRLRYETDATTDTHLAAMVERVFLPLSGEPPRSIAFVGIGAPSSTVTAGSAELLARQTGSNVCVVDANFAAPTLHSHFSVANDRGLSDSIELGFPIAESVQEVRPNLWLLPAGTMRQRPSFASDDVRLRMAQFLARFDYVLLDIGSIAGPGDTGGLAPLVAGVILVVSADATRREAARRATETLRGGGVAVIGAVLTERRFPIPDALYRRL